MQDDLWEALEEYPEARKNLLEKGKQILMKVARLLTDSFEGSKSSDRFL